MKTPLDAVTEIASEMPADAAPAAADEAVVMVAITSMEPAVMVSKMSSALTLAAVAREAL